MWHFHDKRIPLITWTSSWVHSLPCFEAVEHRLQVCSSCSSPTCEKAVNKTRCFLSFSTKLEQWGGGWALDGTEFHRGGATCIRPLVLTVLGRLGGDAHITGGFGSRREGRRWTSSQIPWSPHGHSTVLITSITSNNSSSHPNHRLLPPSCALPAFAHVCLLPFQCQHYILLLFF